MAKSFRSSPRRNNRCVTNDLQRFVTRCRLKGTAAVLQSAAASEALMDLGRLRQEVVATPQGPGGGGFLQRCGPSGSPTSPPWKDGFCCRPPNEQRPIDPPEVNRAFVFLTKPLGLAPHQAEGLSLRLGGPSTDRDKKSENYSWSSRVRSHAATRCLAWRTASGVISRSLATVWDASPARPCRSKAVRVLPSNWPRACRIRSMTYS